MAYAIEFQGKQFLPDGKAEIPDTKAHNSQVEQEEIAWLKTAPEKCFLYVKFDTNSNGQTVNGRITTFLGTVVSTCASFGRKATIGFGFNTYRRSVTCLIFGVRYHGWYYESSGDYCRLKKAKVRA